jgi:hypothetical protein
MNDTLKIKLAGSRAVVAQTGSLPYRGLSIRRRSQPPRSADCQSAKQQSATLRYNLHLNRFAACTEGSRLLIFLSEAARRATTGGMSWEFGFSASCHFRDDFTPPMSADSLTRHEIFRGKVSRRKNQNQKQHLDERTHPRQNP